MKILNVCMYLNCYALVILSTHMDDKWQLYIVVIANAKIPKQRFLILLGSVKF